MTTSILIKDLQVGDRLPDTKDHGYGQYVNQSIDSIRTTKAGRYVITITRTWQGNDGEVVTQQNAPYSNGAIVGTNSITILK